jgi:hypothetical protein
MSTRPRGQAYIIFLFVYILVIFVGGLLLAFSAFKVLPVDLNLWVEETLYPGFSPLTAGAYTRSLFSST